MADHVSHKHQYKHTLHLPHTDFPIRAHSRERDPQMIQRWHDEDLFTRVQSCNAGNVPFIIHDGPPYANGHIHLGHAYNKILKDILAKARRMMGYHVHVVPGWDCHGLPIEQKVASQQPELSGSALKRACRDYALRWIQVQKEEFQRLGVFMDWEHPYVTMSYSYQSSVVRVLATLYRDGFMTRKNKTVSWCPTCQTVLAAAEIEYQEVTDPSVYVAFPLSGDVLSDKLPQGETASVVIWTTTPWTLPLNRAVALRPDTAYALVEYHQKHFIVAQELVSEVFGSEAQQVATINSNHLRHAVLTNPITQQTTPVILDPIADTSEGAGAVHIAPGCGPVDYEIGVKYGLEIYSPIYPDGSYTEDITPADLAGMSIQNGGTWILQKLSQQSYLVQKRSYQHSYPHCWRCHNPLIFRATPQWFIDLETNNVKQRALDAVADIQFAPPQGKNFLYATVQHRWEWCISRQRSWGVPIPALISRHGDPAYTSEVFMQQVAEKIAQHGIEYWDQATPEKLRQEGILPSDFPVQDYVCETDILDVWFDAGVSHYAVLKQRPELSVPADLYLEGVDQHRGWFQSSLFTGMALYNQAPMRGIMTHGFTVDAEGHKMSKSRGNVVSPQDMMKRVGTDGLRLWVASIGNEGDAVVSDEVLTNVTQVYRKVRNTCRFLLQNVYDYDHTRDGLPLARLLPVDRYALEVLYDMNQKIISDYQAGDVSAIFHRLADYVASDLSSFYMDIVKDRLYCEAAEGPRRRSVQTVFWYILDTLTRLLAPICSFTAEQLADHYQSSQAASIHMQHFNVLSEIPEAYAHEGIKRSGSAYDPFTYDLLVQQAEPQFPDLEIWSHVLSLREVVLKAIEQKRRSGVIHHSLEARVILYVDDSSQLYHALHQLYALSHQHADLHGDDVIREAFVVSQIVWQDTPDELNETELSGVYADVVHAHGDKCPRCWHWDSSVRDEGICRRCAQVLDQQD